MTQREKVLEKIRNNPNDVPFETLHSLLTYYGFIHRRGKGSHNGYVHSEYSVITPLTIPYRQPVKVFYVKQAIERIDDVIAYREMGV